MKPLNLEDMMKLDFNTDLMQKEIIKREKKSELNRKNHQTWDDTFERWIQRHLYKSTQNNAKAKGVKNTLSPTSLIEMWKIQDGKCAMSGVEMVWGEKDHIRRASVDQIYPQGGYTLENTWLVCSGLNFMKNKFSLTEMLEIFPQAIEVPLFRKVYEEVISNRIPSHNNLIHLNNLENLF
jgi:hypothetical protein